MIASPDNKIVLEMDGKFGGFWRESISFIAQQEGTYNVQIFSYGIEYYNKSYSIELIESHPKTRKDEKRIQAETLLNEGIKLSNEALAEYDVAKEKEAIRKFTDSIELWKELKEPYWRAVTFFNISWTQFYFSQFEQAIETFSKSLEIFRELKDLYSQGKILIHL